MKKLLVSVFALGILALFAVPGMAAGKKGSFTGYISDDSCGLDHSKMEEMGGMGKDDKMCTLKCVEKGGKFVLADKAKKKVYKLDDQTKPQEFAGAKVKVAGTLEGDTIQVEAITASK